MASFTNLHIVFTSGLTTYNNFTYIDENGNTIVIDLVPGETYYLNAQNLLISPDPDVFVQSYATPNRVLSFSGGCDESRFSFLVAGAPGFPNLIYSPFSGISLNDYVYFNSAVQTTFPLVQTSGCFQLVSSGLTIPVDYPLYPTISFFDGQLNELTIPPYSYLNANEFTVNLNACLRARPCPTDVVYLSLCCQTGNPEIDFFGLQVPDSSISLNQTYFVETAIFSGCATVIELDTSELKLVTYYVGNYTITEYLSCESCTENTIPCYETPKPVVTPTVTLTTLKNECDPITIFPLGVSCVATNPTSRRGNNGTISLTITGGTPPYFISWDNGNLGPYITNLSVGIYTATVIDYYGDFTATTTCVLFLPPPPSTTTTTTTTLPPPYDLCINNKNFSADPDYNAPNPHGQVTFIHNGFVDGYATWVSDNGNFIIFWNDEFTPPAWQISGETIDNSPGLTIINPNPDYPPVNGWQTLGDNAPTTSTLGTCYREVLCARISGTCVSTGVFQGNFPMTQNGSLNGYPVWTSSSLPCGQIAQWSIVYNSGTTTWETIGLTAVPGFGFESYRGDGPIGTWSNPGTVYTMQVINNSCGSSAPVGFFVTTNEPSEGSDGNIVILPSGGVPPHTFSIDGGTTYKNTPIFNDLKSGTYVVVVKDTSGDTASKTVILSPPTPITNYSISLNTVETTSVSTSTTLTKIFTTTVVVSPSLPSGTTITFSLLHLNDFRTSPTTTAATNINATVLTKNSTAVSANTISSSTGTTFNNLRGCQLNTLYISATTEEWQNLTISYGDTITIATTDTVSKVSTSPCYIGTSSQTYSITNASISGCSSCTLSTS